MTDEELIEQVARAIDPAAWEVGQPIPTREAVVAYHSARQASIAKARAILPIIKAEVDKWRNAVIDELTSLHIYSAEHDADPRKAVRDIVEWNQRLALDPAVSAEARALMVRGGEMVKEAAAKHCGQCSSQHRKAHKNAQARKQRQEARDFESMAMASAFRGFEIRALSVPAIVEAGDG